MAIGDDEPEEQPGIEFVDWHDLFARNDGDEAIIPGLAYRGRWTALAAPAKAGKSTVILGLAVGVAQTGLIVMYIDAEMGRGDILDRVEEWMHLTPDDLANMRYTDLPPKLDTVEGAGRLAASVAEHKPDLVIIDGINGVISGIENDDAPWRDLYEWVIAPLKMLNIAILTADNTGHSDKNRPRGHSVKLDKADAVVILERTDKGVKLTTNLKRTASYPHEQHYVVSNASEEGPAMSVTPVDGGQPEGTSDIVAILNRLDVPLELGMKPTARLLREHGHHFRNTTIQAAVRTRRLGVPAFVGTLEEPPDNEGCPDGGCPKDPPPVGGVPQPEEFDPFA